jgi:hypothetical protein
MGVAEMMILQNDIMLSYLIEKMIMMECFIDEPELFENQKMK